MLKLQITPFLDLERINFTSTDNVEGETVLHISVTGIIRVRYWSPAESFTYLFFSTSCCFSSGNFCDNFKNRCFLAWAFVFALLCSFTKKKKNWQHLAVFSPPSGTPLSTMLWSPAVMHLILVKATWPRINQFKSIQSGQTANYGSC